MSVQTQTHVAQSEEVSQQSTSLLSPPVNTQSPLSLTSSPSHSINTSIDGQHHSLQPTVVPGTPFIALHPPVEPLPPDLAYIQYELDKVIDQFENNSYKTRESFTKSDVPVYQVRTYIKIRKKMYFKTTKFKVENELNHIIQQITTYDSLFDLLERYVSWFNYEILVNLVNTFLEQNHDLVISWKSYENKLKEYFSLGKGVRVVSNPTIRGLPEAVGTKVMIIKVEKEDHPFNDCTIFHKALAKALNQSDIFLYLCAIATGCVELRFVIPDFLFDEIFPLNSQQINITLPNLGITAIHCDSYHVEVNMTYYHVLLIIYIYSSLQQNYHRHYYTIIMYRMLYQVL